MRGVPPADGHDQPGDQQVVHGAAAAAPGGHRPPGQQQEPVARQGGGAARLPVGGDPRGAPLLRPIRPPCRPGWGEHAGRSRVVRRMVFGRPARVVPCDAAQQVKTSTGRPAPRGAC